MHRPHTPHRLFRARRALTAFVVLLVFLSCIIVLEKTAKASAATFEDYTNRVHDAMLALESLASPDEDEEETEETVETDEEAEARVLLEVRQKLPAREKVEWDGGSIEVDNSWLHAALDDYARKSATDTEARTVALWRISERLGALGERLAQTKEALQSAQDGRRDKDAEKGRLASILRRPEYNQSESKNESALARLFEWIKNLLRELIPQTSPLQPGASPGLTTAAQILVYSIGIGLVAFILWKYGGRLFRRGAQLRLTPRRPRVVLGELLTPEQTASDLLAEAERLARTGDVRGAIRKAYIALLCELSDRNIIRLAQHKTNRDYLEAVRERAKLFQAMRPLTQNFERHWYGFEAATEEDWSNFYTGCRQALKQE